MAFSEPETIAASLATTRFSSLALAHIAKYHDSAKRCAHRIEDGRGAVVERKFSGVPGNQNDVVAQRGWCSCPPGKQLALATAIRPVGRLSHVRV